jgi:hypothetical protein
MYKIIDNQGGGLMKNEVFNTKKEVIDRLARFHNSDFKESLGDKGIFDMLDGLKDEDERLDWLLEWGMWEIEEIDRKTLYRMVVKNELDRVSSLSYEELSKECAEWFVDEELECDSREDLIKDYMNDWERWQNDKNEDELLEIYNR